MTFTLGSPQCFAIVVILFGFLGFLQGWRRAVVLMGFTLAAILILLIGGANGISQVLFVRIPQTINLLTGGAIGASSPPPPSTSEVLISELLVIGLAMVLGFVIGGRAFPSIKAGSVTFTAHTSERFLGIIPGLVTGFFLIYYLSRILAANQTLSVGATAPSQSSLGSYIVILVVICIVAIIVALLTARLGK